MQVTVDKKNNQCKLKTTKVTFKQSLMGACTNFMFKLGAIGGLKKVPQFLKSSPSAKQLVILGQVINDQMVARQRLSKIIWFTYREKIKIAQDINSDVGWGCLPRVGQMVLAQAISKHLISKGEKMDQKQYLRIIKPFLEDSEQSSSYSLSTILKYARWKHRIDPGDWFNIGQLSDVLRKIQEQIPIKGTQKLKIVFFSQSVIFINLIIEQAKINPCKCEDKKILCLICNQKSVLQQNNNQKQNICPKQKQESIQLKIYQYDSRCQKVIESLPVVQILEPIKQQKLNQIFDKKWEIYDNENIKEWDNQQSQKQQEKQNQNINVEDNLSRKSSLTSEIQLENSLLLIVSVRIAEKVIDAFDYNAILSLLSLPSNIGIIGGVPSKALYIVGYEGDQVLYLDPHYVQQHVDKQNYVSQLHTFFCTEYRTLSRSALDPSMAFCFYLRTLEELQNLLIRIQQLKQMYRKDGRSFFISVMQKNTFEQQYKSQKCGGFSDSPENVPASFEYSSLQFRDITDSF